MRTSLKATTAHLTFLVVITWLVYANSLSVPFLFDDFISIVNNPAISSVYALTDDDQLDNIQMFPDLRNSIKIRTFSYLTFFINRHLNGLNPVGYHLVNISIHAANACFVYLLTTTLMSLACKRSSGTPVPALTSFNTNWTALIAALLFAVHPVQTSAVTYITQRFTSLVTLLYLLALILYINGRCSESNKKGITYLLLSFMTTMLAMDTKEIAFTIPIVITIVEMMFLNGRLPKRLLTLVPFYLTMLTIPLTIWSINSNENGFGKAFLEATNMMNLDNIPRSSYLFTQFRVIMTYFRVMLFPVNLNFDYNYHVFNSFMDPQVFSSFAILIIFLFSGLYFLKRARNQSDPRCAHFRMGAFGIFWFFITISMTSSIIPINDVINEYRLYLPSVGFILFLTFIVDALLSSSSSLELSARYRKCGAVFCAVVICVLAVATVSRNQVYQDRLKLWQDVVRKSPGKLRSSDILANVYMSRNMPDAAIETLKDLVRLNPRLGKPHYYLGSVYLQLNRFEEALEEFKMALAIRRDKAEIHIGLTEAYLGLGKISPAMDSLRTVIQLEPNNPAVPQLLNRLNRLN